jgi:hypothetical protein
MMGSIKKIGKILAGVLVLILIAPRMVSAAENSTSSYLVNGISFNYPSSWIISYDERNTSNIISASKPEFSFLSVAPFQVQITPNYGISKEGVETQINTIIYPVGWNKVSNQTITIDGQDAYLQVFDVYSIWPPMWDYKVEIITFSKNNNTYELLFESPRDEFDNENFQVIIDSFKVE